MTDAAASTAAIPGPNFAKNIPLPSTAPVAASRKTMLTALYRTRAVPAVGRINPHTIMPARPMAAAICISRRREIRADNAPSSSTVPRTTFDGKANSRATGAKSFCDDVISPSCGPSVSDRKKASPPKHRKDVEKSQSQRSHVLVEHERVYNIGPWRIGDFEVRSCRVEYANPRLRVLLSK